MEDEIFEIVTDLIRDDISKDEAVRNLLSLFNVSGSVCDECTDGSVWLSEMPSKDVRKRIKMILAI